MSNFLEQLAGREQEELKVKKMTLPVIPFPAPPDQQLIVQDLPMGEIYADEDFNCRGRIAPIDVVELAKNISEMGLIQPIIVQPWTEKKGYLYRVVAGYRRYMAHQVNKATTIKSIIREGLSEDDARFLNLSENLNRQNLNIMQEARVVQTLLDRGHTQDEIKERLNTNRMWVQVRAYALALPKEIQVEVEAGWIKQEHILALNTLRKDPIKQIELAKTIKEKKQRGETVKLSKKIIEKKSDTKMARSREQTQKMLEHIMEHVGPSFGTRCLAWASGEISTQELYLDIRDEASDNGKTYFIPKYDISSEI